MNAGNARNAGLGWDPLTVAIVVVCVLLVAAVVALAVMPGRGAAVDPLAGLPVAPPPDVPGAESLFQTVSTCWHANYVMRVVLVQMMREQMALARSVLSSGRQLTDREQQALFANVARKYARVARSALGNCDPETTIAGPGGRDVVTVRAFLALLDRDLGPGRA